MSRPNYPIRRYVEVLGIKSPKQTGTNGIKAAAMALGAMGYNDGMKKFQDELQAFLNDVNKESIKKDKVEIGTISDNIKKYLLENKVKAEAQTIFLSVRRLKHILRDSKQKAGKGIPEKHISKLAVYLMNPTHLIIDLHPKHKNIVYVYEEDNRHYKIVVSPINGEIITCGIFNLENMNMKEYTVIF